MKNRFQVAILFFLSLFIISCDNDDDAIIFDENINQVRFTGIELGNSQLVLPQSNVDIHTEFDYAGTSKVTKIFFDVIPFDVPNVREGETAWELTDHLVPVERYEGQLNPHIHYHVYFDEENKYDPSITPAEGVYKFKITVEHEDGSKSAITKELHIIQKFKNMKIGDNNVVALGTDKLPTSYEYLSGNNTVTEIKYQLWFEEWREGQNVEVGKWDNIEVILPENLYKGIKNPNIQYNFDLIKGSPAGGYWLNIYAKESGESEAVKLSIPFEVK
ncbi:hypothetical protein [Aquimarina sediminis]|uniref:hypothetical protein n=1 Tax=Aquimarina sediminis TaxID=2070536 RepID=UPI000CA053D0|nr:hypothetical protein [Aquimarina sediminis]